jgi:hypothetical protein
VADQKQIDSLVHQMHRRSRVARALIFIGLFTWAGGLVVLTSGQVDQSTYTLVMVVSTTCLLITGLISISLAIRNSYVLCPGCGKSFFTTGLFVGYLNPVGRCCSNCKLELKLDLRSVAQADMANSEPNPQTTSKTNPKPNPKHLKK